MTQGLRNLRAALGRVFVQPLYIALAAVLGMLASLLAVWGSNLRLLFEIFSGSDAPLAEKLGIALSLLGGLVTNFDLLSASYTIAIAVLFGVTTAMTTWFLRRRHLIGIGRSVSIGSGAMASGVLGIGCAACGSLILNVVLPSLGVAGAVAALPLEGEEFGILSVALLFISLLLVSKSIEDSVSCALLRATSVERPTSADSTSDGADSLNRTQPATRTLRSR